MSARSLPLDERLAANVSPEPNTGCWLWTAYVNHKGYGYLADRQGHNLRAHRVAWALAHGSIPPEAVVCHKCDTPSCVNPDHLFLGTTRDNLVDCCRKGRDHSVGERNINAKLTAGDVAEIRRALRRHESLTVIARRYGVGFTAISKIKRGVRWRDAEAKQEEKQP